MKKKIIVLVSVLILFVALLAVATVVYDNSNSQREQENLYSEATHDAVFADEDEIYPLVTLTKDDELVSWDSEDRVLLLTYHSYPESYTAGEEVTIEWGDVWTFTDKELEKVYDREKNSVSDWNERLEQLVGVKEDSGYTVITGIWVDVDDILRPAYQSDPTNEEMTTTLAENTNSEYAEWFDENILFSYFYDEYPWTRLGYTYDWKDNNSEYGVTEFLVKNGSTVKVEYTLPPEELFKIFDKN